MPHTSRPGQSYCHCPTRSAVLRVALDRAAAAGATTMTDFVLVLVGHYLDRTPEHERIDALRHLPRDVDVRVYEADREALRKQVSRMRDGALRIPADLEEPWVLALPEPWRTEALDALAARHGLLAVPLPDGAQILGGFGRFMASSGESMAAMEPIVADGLLNADDIEHIPEALTALQKLMRNAASLMARLEAVQRAAAGKSVAVTGRERAA